MLLENLLNKMPGVRPTCERVAEAIRKGKVIILRFFPLTAMVQIISVV